MLNSEQKGPTATWDVAPYTSKLHLEFLDPVDIDPIRHIHRVEVVCQGNTVWSITGKALEIYGVKSIGDRFLPIPNRPRAMVTFTKLVVTFEPIHRPIMVVEQIAATTPLYFSITQIIAEYTHFLYYPKIALLQTSNVAQPTAVSPQIFRFPVFSQRRWLKNNRIDVSGELGNCFKITVVFDSLGDFVGDPFTKMGLRVQGVLLNPNTTSPRDWMYLDAARWGHEAKPGVFTLTFMKPPPIIDQEEAGGQKNVQSIFHFTRTERATLEITWAEGVPDTAHVTMFSIDRATGIFQNDGTFQMSRN